MSRRELMRTLVTGVMPSRYPAPDFQAMTGGNFEPGFGSSCGFPCHMGLHGIGARDPRLVNWDDPAWGLKYRPGENIAMLVQGAKAVGAWRTLDDSPEGPQLGDVIFFNDEEATPRSEHVATYLDGFTLAGVETWVTADAGHPSADASDPNVQRTRSGNSLRFTSGPRRIRGWVDLDALELPASPAGNDTGTSGGGLSMAQVATIALGMAAAFFTGIFKGWRW